MASKQSRSARLLAVLTLVLSLTFAALDITVASGTEVSYCGTHVPPDSTILQKAGAAGDCEFSSTTPTIVDYLDEPLELLTVDVVVHNIYGLHGGDGLIDDQRLSDQIAHLNNTFAGGNIEFNLVHVNRIENGDIQQWQKPSDTLHVSQTQIDFTETHGWDPYSYLNIYIVDILPEDVGGWGWYPGAAPGDITRDNVVVDFRRIRAFGGADDLHPFGDGDIVPHEVGHYLNLHHTFEQLPETPPCGSATAPACYEDGDLICDTNPEEFSRPDGADIGSFGCPEGTRIDCAGLPAPVDNLMSYRNDVCRGLFTTEQIARARCALLNWRPFLLVPPEFSPGDPTLASAAASQSAAWADLDGDAHTDLVVVNDSGYANEVFINNGDGSFHIATGTGLEEVDIGAAVAAGDHDNDGDLDVVVANAEEGPNFGNVRLFTNQGALQFLSSEIAGVPFQEDPRGIAWADFDHDGILDIFVPDSGLTGKLYKGRGGGLFDDVTSLLPNITECVSASWGDANLDGWPDLIVTPGGEYWPYLYINQGDGTFQYHVDPELVWQNVDSATWQDFDNDGDLDICLLGAGISKAPLFQNTGGAFVWHGVLPGIDSASGASWADYDNDGDLDCYVVSSGGASRLFANDGQGNFTEASSHAISGEATSVTWADVDADGDMDVYITNADRENVFLMNDVGADNNWLATRLVGTAGNTSAIGARVVATVGVSQHQTRVLSSGSGSGQANELIAHFGLGQATEVSSLVVYWPTGGTTTLTNVAANQTIEVVQSAAIFDEQSEATTMEYQGTPYATTPFDADGDGDDDLIVSIRGSESGLWENLGQPGVPVFAPRTEWFGSGEVPADGQRGVAAADYDNDGDIDFFAAHESTPRLYENVAPGSFVDVGSSVLIAALADKSWAGAWGDYDRDGWLDLYVARASLAVGMGEDPTPDNLVGETDRLFRSRIRTEGVFTNRVPFNGMITSGTKTVAATWEDIDGDGFLDLFASHLAPLDAPAGEWSPLYWNQGDGTFVDVAGNQASGQPTISTLGRVSGAVFSDVNGDQLPDILLATQLGTSGNAVVHFNTPGTPGDFTDSGDPAWQGLPTPEGKFVSVGVSDIDLNGTSDAVFLPLQATNPVVVYAGAMTPRGLSYADLTGHLGLHPGFAAGIALADFNLDGDMDLYLAREDDEFNPQFFYQNERGDGDDAPANRSMTVRLSAGTWSGFLNDTGIGTRVTMEAPSVDPLIRTTRRVSGGNGRGGQPSGLLEFGLGAIPDGTPVRFSITWPDGYQDVYEPTVDYDRSSRVYVFPELPHAPGLRSQTFQLLYQLRPDGDFDLVAQWETDFNSDPDLLEVTMANEAGKGGQIPPECADVGGTEGERLTASTPGVVTAVTALPGGGYLNEVRRRTNAPCAINCKFVARNPKCGMGTMTSENANLSAACFVSICVQ